MIDENLLQKLENPNYSFFLGENIYGRFRFPFDAIKPGMRIIIYGGGVVGKTFLQQIARSSYCIVRAVCDQNPGNTHIVEVSVISVAELSGMEESEYDFIVIAIEKRNIAVEIREDLKLAGIDDAKIVWIDPSIRGVLSTNYRSIQMPKQTIRGNDEAAKEETHVKLFHPEKSWLSRKGFIFMDTTRITMDDWGGGIQRTVNKLYRKMVELGGNVVPVRYASDRNDFITSRKYKCRMEDTTFDNFEYSLSISKCDTLLFMDNSWDFEDRLLMKAAEYGVCISTLVYDLIPIRLTSSHRETVRSNYKKWIQSALLHSDSILCITHTVADDVIQYYQESHFKRRNPLDLYVIHLGCEIVNRELTAREKIREFVEGRTVFLMVGTVETRKNHALVLDAFRKIYSDGSNKDIRLLILGRKGWMVDEFQKLYGKEELLRGRVLWIQDAADGEVQWAYRHCCALIASSKMEGLGLPLLEAAHFNLPILCSDIPVFREVVGEHGNYFKVNDSEAIRTKILEWLSNTYHPSSNRIRLYSWEETAREVLDILHGRTKPYYSICDVVKQK